MKKVVKMGALWGIFLLLAGLIANLAIRPVQAKTLSSGYHLSVTYQDGYAVITPDVSQVKNGYRLKRLTTTANTTANPYTFSDKVLNNGTYHYTLTYELPGISQQEQQEDIQVVVDKLQHSSQAQWITKLADQDRVLLGVYAYENYDINGKTPAMKLGEINISEGDFTTNKREINNALAQLKLNDRQYYFATLYRENGTELPIDGIWQQNGKLYYLPTQQEERVGNLNSNRVGIAYQALSGDEVRLYAKLNDPKTYRLNVDQLTMNSQLLDLNIAPDPKKVVAGSQVMISFKWDIKIDNVELQLDGQPLSPTKNYDKIKRYYEATFSMPAKDATISLIVTEKLQTRYVGIYNSSNLYFNAYEIGGSKLDVVSTPVGTNKTKAYSYVRRSYREDLVGGYGQVPIYNQASLYEKLPNQTNKTYQDYYTQPSDKVPSEDRNDFFVQSPRLIEGYLDRQSQQKISYPVQDYTVGTPLEITYDSKRGTGRSKNGYCSWWLQGDALQFDYTLPKSGRIDVYSQEDRNSTNYQKDFTTFTFPIYQTKEEYQKDDPSKYDQSKIIGTDKATSALNQGYYPVATTLDNGMEVIAYPQWYNNDSAFNDVYYMGDGAKWGTSDAKSQDITGLYFKVTLVIKNAYDDIRVVMNEGASTANNWYNMNSYSEEGISDIKVRGGTNSGTTVDADQYSSAIPGKQFVVGGKYAPRFDVSGQDKNYTIFRVKPQDGYTIPVPTLYAHSYTDNSDYVVDGSQSIAKLSGDSITGAQYKQIGRRFIEGIIGGKQWVQVDNNANHDVEQKIAKQPFYTDDGYFNYSLFIKDENGSFHDVVFKNEPLSFDVTYDKLMQANQTNLNIKTQRYFSVPLTVPKEEQGFFQGWHLQAIYTGNDEQQTTIELQNPNRENGYYYPQDLLDIKAIYTQLKPQLSSNIVGVKKINLAFIADMQAQSSSSGSGYVNRYYQSSYDKYAKYDQNTITAMRGSSFQITGIGPNLSIEQGFYLKNKAKTQGEDFITDFQPSTTPSTLLDVYYDKPISVAYTVGQGSGQAPSDSTTYTTIADSSLSSKVQIQSGQDLTPPNGLVFAGWVLKAGDVTGKDVYDPQKQQVDLAQITDPVLAKAIYDSGKVTLEASYRAQLGPVTNQESEQISNIATTAQTGIVVQGDTYQLAAQFKFASGDLEKLHYAIYAKGRQQQQYQLLWYNGKRSDFTNSTKLSDVSAELNEEQLQVNFKVNEASYQVDHQTQYRVVAWSDANELTESWLDANKQPQLSHVDQSGDFTKIPAVTITTAKILEPFELVETTTKENKRYHKKLAYAKTALQFSFDVTTPNQISYTQAEINDLLKQGKLTLLLAKKAPKESRVDMWWLNTFNFNDHYSQGAIADWGKKADVPTLTVSGTKLICSIKNLKDTSEGITSTDSSQAHWYAYLYNQANQNAKQVVPDLHYWQGDGTQANSRLEVANPSEVTIPHYELASYVVNEAANTPGKAFDNMLTYPSATQMQANPQDRSQLQSPKLQVSLSAVWTTSEGVLISQGGGISQGDQTDVSSDDPTTNWEQAYQVTLQGDDITTSDQQTSLKLTQKTTNKSFDAQILKVDATGQTKPMVNGQLGELKFVAQGGPTCLWFKLQTKPNTDFQTLVREPFSATINYVFERRELT